MRNAVGLTLTWVGVCRDQEEYKARKPNVKVEYKNDDGIISKCAPEQIGYASDVSAMADENNNKIDSRTHTAPRKAASGAMRKNTVTKK